MTQIEEIIQSLKPFVPEAFRWELLWKTETDPYFRARLREEILKTKKFIDNEHQTDWRTEAQKP